MRITRREFIAASAAAAITVTKAARSVPQASDDAHAATPVWRQFKGDARRTGRSTLQGPLDPQPRWHTDITPIQSPMSVNARGTVYFAGNTGAVYAYRLSGDRLWVRTVAHSYVTGGTAILQDGSILVVAETGRAVCYSPDGTAQWIFDLQDYSGPSSAPLVASDGTIYMGNQSGLFALHPDGSPKWHHPTARVSGPPA